MYLIIVDELNNIISKIKMSKRCTINSCTQIDQNDTKIIMIKIYVTEKYIDQIIFFK